MRPVALLLTKLLLSRHSSTCPCFATHWSNHRGASSTRPAATSTFRLPSGHLRTSTVDSGLVQSASIRPKMPVLAMPGCAAKNSTPLMPDACARFCSSCREQGRARLSPSDNQSADSQATPGLSPAAKSTPRQLQLEAYGIGDCAALRTHPHGQDGVQLGGAVHCDCGRLANAPAAPPQMIQRRTLTPRSQKGAHHSGSAVTGRSASCALAEFLLLLREEAMTPNDQCCSRDCDRCVPMRTAGELKSALTPGCPSRCPRSWTRRGWW